MILSAPDKAGKSEFNMNLARCALDGGNFLGTFPVTPIHPEATYVMMDLEMRDEDIERLIDQAGIINRDRLIWYSLSNRMTYFDFTDTARGPHSMHQRIVDTLIDDNCGFLSFDNFRPYFDALGFSTKQDSHVERVLRGIGSVLDTVREELGWPVEFAGYHHTAKATGEASGAGNWGSWPDVPATLAVDDHGVRSFRVAQGRGGIVVPRMKFTRNPTTGHLTALGSTAGALPAPSAHSVSEAVLAYLREHPSARSALETALKDSHGRDQVRDCVKTLLAEGLLTEDRDGRRVILRVS